MKTYNLFLLPLVMSLLSGCAGEEPKCGASKDSGDGNMCEERLTAELTIDSSFSYEQQFAIIRAGQSWARNTQSRAYLTWVISDTDPDIFLGDCGKNTAGFAYAKTGKICLIQADASLIETRVTHELGHFFGLGHETGLMRPTLLFAGETIYQEDIAHFDRLWNERK